MARGDAAPARPAAALPPRARRSRCCTTFPSDPPLRAARTRLELSLRFALHEPRHEHVLERRELGEEVMKLKDEPDRAIAELGGQARHLFPASRMVPVVGASSVPMQCSSHVDLPAPEVRRCRSSRRPGSPCRPPGALPGSAPCGETTSSRCWRRRAPGSWFGLASPSGRQTTQPGPTSHTPPPLAQRGRPCGLAVPTSSRTPRSPRSPRSRAVEVALSLGPR